MAAKLVCATWIPTALFMRQKIEETEDFYKDISKDVEKRFDMRG